MGHFSDLHGYIMCLNEYEQHNVDQIHSLPSEDTRSLLTCEMFATPHPRYDEQMLAFGQSYNGVESYWEKWLETFESLLKKLYWYEAHVHLITDCWGTYHYSWTPEDSGWNPAVSETEQSWIFSGGPRTGLRDLYVSAAKNSDTQHLRYPIIIEKGPTSYGAYSPDLPGCVAAGDTVEEVRVIMKEAIEMHIKGMLEDGKSLPEPSATEWVDIAVAP